MITGGQRSGKSLFAEHLALSRSDKPCYLATARVYDEEFRKRVDVHKARRGDRWVNLEIPLKVSEAGIGEGDVVLLDCLTLLATNWFFECGEDVKSTVNSVTAELETLFSPMAVVIIVTNEIGLGGVSPNALQRRFADVQGAVNQWVAERASEVYLVVSGIPVKIR